MKYLSIFLLLVFFHYMSFAQVTNREHFINYDAFDLQISQLLDANVKGYQYAIGDETGLLYENSFGVAKEAADNGGNVLNWTNSTQMVTASVAKMFCTVAILDMLEDANIPGAPTLDDKLNLFLEDYIPMRWRDLIDGTEDDIQLKHLLRHHSGLTGGLSLNPRTALSGTVNVSIPDAFDYENVNFELAGYMALYMTNPDIMGNLEAIYENSSDIVYDFNFVLAMQDMYDDYVQLNIMAPAGISCECARNVADPSTMDVYRYGSPSDSDGSTFGNVTTCMSNGWILSATDMINFMQKWNNPGMAGNILSQASVDFINDFSSSAQSQALGWIWNRDAYNGNIEGYAHNGILWTCNTNSPACEVYTSGIMLLEDNVYLAINVNSNAAVGSRVNRTVDLLTAYNAAVCSTSLIVNDANKKTYHSTQNEILTTPSGLNVSNNEKVLLKAGTFTKLVPGFHAKSGSTFSAYISDCSTFPTF